MPVQVFNPIAGTYGGSYPAQQPAILVSVSGTVTFSVEVTGDDVTAAGYVAASGTWVAFTGLSGLNASTAATLGAVVSAIRPHITAGTGSVTFQFIQFTGGAT